jgi:hypothetical protein
MPWSANHFSSARATNSVPLSSAWSGLGAISSERDIHAPVLRLSLGRVVR